MSSNNNPQAAQQPQTIQYSNQTSDGNPPMSLVGGGTNAIPTLAQVPQQMSQPIAPQQMAQQAAAMPTASTVVPNPTGVTDGIMPDGSYNPKYDQTINQIAGRMKYMQQSGAFQTPYQRAMQQHPILMGLGNGLQALGQGITKQPFYTGNQENQASLQNTQESNAANLMSPTNMMNMMFMKQMMGGGQQPTSIKPSVDFTDPGIMKALNTNAPKGATHFSPTIGYTDDQGNPVK